jgi:hypothetical protein
MQENINIPDSEITTNLSFRQLVLMNMQQLTNFPYIEKDFDALTDYELLCLVVKFLNDVIANQNEQNASITRMYESFLALQDYVNNTKDELEDAFNNLDDYVRNYFANLDVQDEINNKLDQMLEDGVLEQIIEQFLQSTALWCFDNVADMKQATNLINGSYAKTLGYYSNNDGGQANYKISSSYSENDYYEELDSGLYAILNEKTNVNTMMFGCKNDKSEDISTKLNTAINYVKNNTTDKTINFLSGSYLISSSINVPVDVSIDGNGANVYVNFNGYGFLLNSNGSSWIISYPNQYFSEFKNLNIYNNNKNTYTGAKGINLGCATRIINCFFYELSKAIVQSGNDYIDNKYIEKCVCFDSISEDYDIILRLGDGLFINQLMDFKISITNCGGANLLNCINTKVDLTSCTAINISGFHNERYGEFIIKSSRCTFKNLFVYRDPLFENVFDIKKYDNCGSSVILENIEIRYSLRFFNYTTELNDIKIDNFSNLVCNNVYNYLSNYDGLDGSPLGFKLNNEIINNNCVLINKNINQSNNLHIASDSINYNYAITNVVRSTQFTGNFLIEDGTIYYKTRQYWDTTRLIRIPYTEDNNYNITITNNNQTNSLVCATSQLAPNCFIRIYRGNANNNFDKYVDIPSTAFNIKNMIDTKQSIQGCYFWKNRDSGNVDGGLNSKYYEKKGENVIIKSTTTPTYGTWSKGDVIINSNPSAGGTYGWICTTSGTPGTWKSLGNIEA